MRSFLMLCVCFCLFVAISVFSDVTLVDKGVSSVVIVCPDTDAIVSAGVKDLKNYMNKITGAEIPVLASLNEKIPDGKVALFVEKNSKDEAVKGFLQNASVSLSGYVVSVNNKRILLTGTTSQAVAFACADFLGRLGVRWYMPGDIGEVYPKSDTLKIKEGDIVEIPDFETRGMRLNSEWSRRNRLGGPGHYGGHAYEGFVSSREYFKEHPEYFSLINGKRVPAQLCVSNPEVVKIFVDKLKEAYKKNPAIGGSSLGPNDGGGFCECDTCRAMDSGRIDPHNGDRDVIDRQIKFMNSIITEVEKEFPGKKYGFYVYHVYQLPPLTVKPNPAIIPIFAPISFCRIHSMGSEVCPDRHSVEKIIQGWAEYKLELWDRDYNFNLAGIQVPFHQIYRWTYDIPFCKRNGFRGFDIESIEGWAVSGPMYYMCAKLLWDADADPMPVLDEYFAGFFGNASEPMKKYVMRMAERLRDADYHTGADFDIPLIYNEEIISAGDNDLQSALKMAEGDEVLKKRVMMYYLLHEYLKAFVNMRKSHESYDFPSAKTYLGKVNELRDELLKISPVAIGGASAGYLKRFWAEAVEGCDSIVANGGEIVAKFPDEWNFLIDTNDIGDNMQLYDSNIKGGNWQKIKTYSQSWADQGLFHYKGIAWYKNTFQVDEKFRGKRIIIWFGGVDEKGKVWINGKLAGEGRSYVWDTYEFDITDFVEFGKTNTVVVKVTNKELDEIGTGGITKIVMVYAR